MQLLLICKCADLVGGPESWFGFWPQHHSAQHLEAIKSWVCLMCKLCATGCEGEGTASAPFYFCFECVVDFGILVCVDEAHIFLEFNNKGLLFCHKLFLEQNVMYFFCTSWPISSMWAAYWILIIPLCRIWAISLILYSLLRRNSIVCVINQIKRTQIGPLWINSWLTLCCETLFGSEGN